MNGRLKDGAATVHAADWSEAYKQMPYPLCGGKERIQAPTSAHVTCRKCLRKLEQASKQ